MRGFASLVIALALMPPSASAGTGTVTIRSGAVEMGVAGSFMSVEGTTTSRFGLGVGQYRRPGGLLLRYAGVVSHERVSDLDVLDLEAGLQAYLRLDEANAWGVVGVAAGLRQEWIGSFSDELYPVGVDAALKLLAGDRAAGTLSYQYRRVFGDPVSDFDEHRFVVGLSLFFRNAKE